MQELMKKAVYQKEILQKTNLDGTVKCEVCGKDSMVAHAFVDHDMGTVRVICNECYLKRLNRDKN